VDIGSNTLKILVARQGPRLLSPCANPKKGGGAPLPAIHPVADFTEDVRISPGPGDPPKRIPERLFAPAADAITRLLGHAARHQAAPIRLVATSCVREAVNAAAFRQFIHAQTGHPVETLSGEEEALGIADGVATDPAITGAASDGLHIIDLGGGSLECILRAPDGEILDAQSLPLGAARLAREFLSDWAAPNPAAEMEALASHVRQTLQNNARPAPLPPENAGTRPMAPAFVGCGGSFTICRAILAARNNLTFEHQSPVLDIQTIRALRDITAALPLPERRKFPGLPASRADIFPAALTILIALAEVTHASAFRHTLHSLRHGLAARLLQNPDPAKVCA
jgi:exopolyphosphatase/guanosine-5'-triphosphate,3'-diphosphate pyrophosphatase